MQTDRVIGYLDDLLLRRRGVRGGNMFGHPAYYVNDKLFACVYGQAVGLKVPETFASELIGNGRAVSFQPYGKRKMREWIQLSAKQVLSGDEHNTIRAALKFVGTLKSLD